MKEPTTTTQSIERRIEAIEARIPAPPEPTNWYKYLDESGFYGQQRADFEAFLRSLGERDWKELTDQEIFIFEQFAKEMNEDGRR